MLGQHCLVEVFNLNAGACQAWYATYILSDISCREVLVVEVIRVTRSQVRHPLCINIDPISFSPVYRLF